MWPNEQINGISFCGALMNGEKRAAFFHMAVVVGGGVRGGITRACTRLKRARWCLGGSALERNQCFL